MARRHAAVAAVFVLPAYSVLAVLAAQDTPAQIRAGTTAVPIDVRVLDRNGRPVTNLQKSDFEVFEDGTRQEITHFSIQDFEAPPAHKSQLAARREPASPAQRTFLIVLGRGRLEPVSKGITGLVRFLESSVDEADRVAILAYKRVTEFGLDRRSLIRLLERYAEGHNAIEARLDHYFLNRNIKSDIDALLSSPGLPEMRELPHRYPPTNVGQLYLAIDYLRAITGEKHIIFVTEDGVNFGQGATASLARMASDARVTISPIQTSGTPLRVRQPSALGGSGMVSARARSMTQAFAYADLRKIARDTGGVSSAYEYAEVTLGRLNRVTRFQYLLGYEPMNLRWDGKHREIEVKVKRSDVTALHRRSYYAGPELLPEDRERMIAESRIASAGRHTDLLKDLRVDVSLASAGVRLEDVSGLDVRLTVNIADLNLEKADELLTSSLHAAIFCGDEDENVIGELWRKVDLKLSPATHIEMLRDGLLETLRVPVSGKPAYVKAVVYEPSSDRVGTSVLTIK